jgi:dipeptidyl-peptidase-3
MNRLLPILLAGLLLGCGQREATPPETAPAAAPTASTPTAEPTSGAADARTKQVEPEVEVSVDRFADIEVLRYRVPGFDELSLQQKEFAYYLAQAALAGHDIIFDQNYEHNLRVRRTLAAIVETYDGDRASDDYAALLTYAKRVWFANGIHHHYSNSKMMPDLTPESFAAMVRASDAARLPLLEGESVDDLLALLTPVLFDPDVAPIKVNLDPDVDQLVTSATNYYRDVTQAEAEAFYAELNDPGKPQQVSWGLNSQLARVDGEIVERRWWIDGMYGPAIERIVYWLNKALAVAENAEQQAWLERLIAFYETGSLEHFDAYSVAWVEDTDSRIDTINGFIEVYGDPLGYRGAWEAVVSIRDLEATDRIAAIGGAAQWFEDNSPIMNAHKKKEVVGISAKVITVVMEGGDAAPSTPIGINLPNADWIRKEHGSKSVTLGNIIDAYNEASAASGLHDEFMLTDAEKARFEAHANLAYNLDVDLHEVIGHASGQINPGVGTPEETLKSYRSALEETRADLVALYYMMDPKLIELGVMDTLEVGKTTYDRFIRNGLLIQLMRIEPGDDIEQAHMRNRQLIAGWVYEKGRPDNVVEKVVQDGKTYFVVRDYDKLRMLFGELLTEVQRIKSEGDYEAGRALVETYGVKVDRALHEEVLARVAPLNIAPYNGFVQPRLTAAEKDGRIVDVQVHYDEDFVTQMLRYEKEYIRLPVVN